MTTKKILLTESPIMPWEYWKPEDYSVSGGHALFIGTVRNNSGNKEVIHLDFESYEPLAISELELIASEMVSNWQLDEIKFIHRLGRVTIGQIAVFISIASAHRKAAFEACEYGIDQLKLRVPIWKKECYMDGSEWVQPTP